MSETLREPISNECCNTGHYCPARWTCCACYHELGDIGVGPHTCPECSHELECDIDMVPSFVTRLADKDDD